MEGADGRSASASSAAGERVFEVNIAATKNPTNDVAQHCWEGVDDEAD